MKPYVVEKEINGKVYKAQFNGLSAALKGADMCTDKDGKVSLEKTADYIFKYVIVEPKMTVDDCESLEELNEIVAFGTQVANGNYPHENGLRDKEKGEK